MVSHIGKDSSNFRNVLGQHCLNGTTLITCDIKSLYNMVFFNTVSEYWIEKPQNDLPQLQCFNKQFILKGLLIILEFKIT